MQHTIVGVRRKTQRCKLYTFKYVCNSTSCIIYSKKSYSTRAVLVLSLVSQCCLTLCCPMDCSSPGSLCLWGFSTQEYWSGLPCPPLWDLPNPGIKTRFPTLQADSLPSEPQEKLKNTGMGCHPLFQGIIPNQGSNPGLPHCRLILYHLSHQGSLRILECIAYPFLRGSS